MNKKNAKVDWYFKQDDQWQEAYIKLRTIALGLPLEEQVKWGHPCYAVDKTNIFLMHGFKEYCAILFFKGALMKDPKGILIQQTKNVQAARQIRFTSAAQVTMMASTLNSYIKEAIDVEKSGAKAKMKKTSEFKMPIEFLTKLESDSRIKKAFESLTPGRQRGYLLYFSSAKQSQTRESRIEKNLDRILDGMGLDD